MLEDPQQGNGRPRHAVNGRKGRREVPGGWPEFSYRELVERVPAVLYVDTSDESSSALYMSPQTDSMFGYSRGEWLEDPDLWVKIFHPEDRERVLGEHDRARRDGGPFEAEYRLVARDGSVVWVRYEAIPIEEGGEEPGQRAGVLLDITDRKFYEEKLRNSEERFRLVAGATGEAIWDNDLLTGVQEWDGATEALFGYPPHRGKTGAWWEERIHPEDKDRVISRLADVLDGDEELWEAEYRFRRADGSYAHVVDKGRVVRDGAGDPVRMVGSMRDVTDSRRHQEVLRRSEELFRSTFEAAAVGMAHLTPNGRWLRINDKLCEISGYPREELLGMSYLDFTLPGDLAAGEERLRRLLDGRTGPYSVERRFVRKDGSRVWVNLSVSLVRGSSGEPEFLVCVAEDVTERKLAELVPDPLNPKEMVVLRLASEGLSNPRIAERLAYSVHAIKLHMRCIYTKLKLEARTRQEVVARAVDIGLIKPHR